MASAGSGDVLAGMITGLCARKMPPFHAACAAVYLHAQAGIMLGAGLVASDLIDKLPILIKEYDHTQ
ncbi:MAG: NAD(P)H-hydrate dehydratase [Alphaproteobacteria bacterium]